MAFSILSSVFADNGSIPKRYTCEGEDVSPPLSWSGVPPGTKSLALIVDDPDAPDPRAPQRTYVHWVLYNIPPDASGIEENEKKRGTPKGALAGRNDWGRTGYGGPCPPIGEHRYFFKLAALDTVLPDLGKPTKAQLLAAMQGHVIAETQTMGKYEKGRG
jgi:Raf kinase inhibitor-like YbhB/YbcL family protein